MNRNHTFYPLCNAAAAQLIPRRRHEEAPDPYGSGAMFPLLLREHLKLDHILDGVLPVIALQGLGAADDGKDQPAESHERNQPAEDVEVRDTAQNGDQDERDRRDQLEIEGLRRLPTRVGPRRRQRVNQTRPEEPEEENREVSDGGRSPAHLLTSLWPDQRLVCGVDTKRPGWGRHLDQTVEGFVKFFAGDRC